MERSLTTACTPDPGYLNTASLGVPPTQAVELMRELLDGWRRGQLAPADFDDHVVRARRAFASIAGVSADDVAIGSAVSELVGLIAAALPDGARVVIAEGEFTSLLFPFLAQADRGVVVEERPLEELAGLRGPADLVAVSAVQSSDGRVADLGAIRWAAQEAGARVLVDVTQSCGWLPFDAGSVDYTVCGAYKWLLAPRGAAFLTVRPDAAEALRPIAAGWFAGDDPWTSIYGSPLRLATSARRFDISPAWFSWAGAAVSLELVASLDRAQVRAHGVGLADAFRAGLGLAPGGSAITTVDTPGAAELFEAAGVRTAVRAGRARVSFHLYNDLGDVQLAVDALTR